MTEIFKQAGRLAVVTGATAGTGYETALALARAGADVVVAGSDEAQGREAVRSLRPQAPTALVRFERLDLTSLRSVDEFAARMAQAGRPVDLLVNNARAPLTRRRTHTADGFEMQFGFNHLGHFALTGLLLPLLRRSRQPRVVHLSPAAHRSGSIHFDDLQLEHNYGPRIAARQAALSVLLFSLELRRRSDVHGWGLQSLAADPGASHGVSGPEDGTRALLWQRIAGAPSRRSPKVAALPVLYAATARAATAGGYYGQSGRLGLLRPPGAVAISPRAQDPETARRLWAVSERLTGINWPDK